MNKRIGLLGGTFNPIHNGHIDLGLKITKDFELNELFYILSANPPHKKSDIAPAPIRWKMLKYALRPYTHLSPCDIEMQSSLPSWTIKTITIFKDQYPSDQLFFISGSEGFLQIQTWKNYKDLFKKISFIVVLRNKSHKKMIVELAVAENLKITDSNNPDADIFLYLFASETINISSTLIRERINKNKKIDFLVPKKINKIIKEYKLYEI